MVPLKLLLLVFYFILLGVLSLYGVHRLIVMRRFWLSRKQNPSAIPIENHPRVTVQLPLYNEHNVAARVIDAAAKLDWPRDRLEIQVLDDSDDDTAGIVNARVKYWQARGIQITTQRRTNREGYKAGALAYGLSSASGEFIAIFDSDFLTSVIIFERCDALLYPRQYRDGPDEMGPLECRTEPPHSPKRHPMTAICA